MTNSSDNIVFDQNACPSLDHMIQYKAGSMDDLTARALEKHVLSCSMCEEVFDFIEPDNVAEMTALTASIDQRIQGHVASAGSGSNFNFNLYMAIAASFVGVLIVVGNLITNTHVSNESVKVHIARQHEDSGVKMGGKEVEEEIAVKENEIVVTGDVEEIINDTIEIVTEERLALVVEEAAETFLEAGETEVASSLDPVEQITETLAASSESTTAETFLFAYVDLLTVKSLAPIREKGSTDKKVSKGKIRNNQGYVPSFDDDEGHPEYAGGDKKLKEDVVKKINDLHLNLAEGGEVEILITVSANGTVGPVKVDEKVSISVASQIQSTIAKLPPWIPGNVNIQYTLKVRLR